MPNKVRFRCTSGFDIITGIDGAGVQTAGTYLIAGDSTWNVISDRARKETFQTVDPLQVLEKVAVLPMSRWNYKSSPGLEHLGPMAQDFHAAFGLGPSDKSIATVDADGVALAAIQGLNQKVEQMDAEIAELRQAVTELKEFVQALSAKLNGGAK